MEILFDCLALLFLTSGSAYFSASEIALFSLPATKVNSYRHSKHPRRLLIANLLSRPQDLLVTVFMLNTLVNILLQNTASNLFGENASIWLKVAVPLFITLFLGEVIPKYIALQKKESVAYYVAPFIAWITQKIKPLRDWIIALTAPISRLMFFFLRKEKEISTHELQHVLRTSKAEGVLSHEEAELIGGYLDLLESNVKEVMRPRKEIVWYDLEDPFDDLISCFVDEECTRIPVCRNTLDHVLGVLSARTYFLHCDKIRSGDEILPLLSAPFYVPETTGARALLQRFEEEKEVFAFIVDEYGSISGIITHEDLAEEVIGEIADRRDLEPLYRKISDQVIIASGKIELDQLEEIFGIHFPRKSTVVTLGGWLIEQMGDIPQTGASYENEHFHFHILAADPNRVNKVYIGVK